MRPGPTISALWTRKTIEAAGDAGVDTAPLWKIAQLDPSHAVADARISDVRHLRVWDAAMRAVASDMFPIAVTKRMRLADYELLALACKTSKDLGAALGVIARYLRVHTDAVGVSIQRSTTILRVRLTRSGKRTVGMRGAMESSVAELWAALQQIAAKPVPVRAAHFVHAMPKSTQAHRALFGSTTRLVFASTFDGLEMDRAAERLPLALADDGLYQHLVRGLERKVSSARNGGAVATNVRHVLLELFPTSTGDDPSMATISGRLGMGARTLQRQLASEKTTLSKVIDAVKKELAATLLSDARRSAGEVGFLLGFSEPAAFHRAFKRWYKTTPTRWRSARASGLAG